jgi:WD40 repeat protein
LISPGHQVWSLSWSGDGKWALWWTGNYENNSRAGYLSRSDDSRHFMIPEAYLGYDIAWWEGDRSLIVATRSERINEPTRPYRRQSLVHYLLYDPEAGVYLAENTLVSSYATRYLRGLNDEDRYLLTIENISPAQINLIFLLPDGSLESHPIQTDTPNSLRWSADGRLAYLNGNQVHLYSLATKEVESFPLSIAEAAISNFEWMGETWVLYETSGQLVAENWQTGQNLSLTALHPDEKFDFSLSPNEKRFILEIEQPSDRDTYCNASYYLADTENQQVNLIQQIISQDHCPPVTWSPDSLYVVWASYHDHHASLYKVEPGKLIQLVRKNEEVENSWAALSAIWLSNSEGFYLSGDEQYYYFDIQTEAFEAWVALGDTLSLSPDEQTLSFIGRCGVRRDLAEAAPYCMVNRQTGESFALPNKSAMTDFRYNAYPITWHPDGEWLFTKESMNLGPYFFPSYSVARQDGKQFRELPFHAVLDNRPGYQATD